MSRSTISTFQLFEIFPNEEVARQYLETRLWPNGAICAKCKVGERITARKNGFYRCNACKIDFTVRTGTIFERSHVPLHKWLYAMYLLVTARKGISSLQLSKEIGITQRSAWFVLSRLREACGHDLNKLRDIIEIDEIYLGPKEHNKHMSQRMYGDAGVPSKTPVLGMRERGGRTKAFVVDTTGALAVENAVLENVELGSIIHTDEYPAYKRLGKTYKHRTINHGLGRYSHNGVTTNSVESVWAVLRRGLHGVYHHASKKHMRRYVNEFTWRVNDGNVKNHTLDRLNYFVGAVTGRQITYQKLIAK
jgi:transposase-like protein